MSINNIPDYKTCANQETDSELLNMVERNSTLERHEDLMFDPNLVVEVKQLHLNKYMFEEQIFVSGKVVHTRTVTPDGTTYKEILYVK